MAVDLNKYRLPVEKVTWRADPSEFSFASTAEVPPPENPLDLIKGQEHAKREILSAFRLRENILLIGPAGTGKSMLAKACASDYIAQHIAAGGVRLTDQVLVHNYVNDLEPEAVVLPTPLGGQFRQDVRQFVRLLPRNGTYIIPDTDLDPRHYKVTLARPGPLGLVTKTYSASLADLIDIASRQLGLPKLEDCMERVQRSRSPLDEPILAGDGRTVTLREAYAEYSPPASDPATAQLDEIVDKYRAYPNIIRYFTNLARDVVENPQLSQGISFLGNQNLKADEQRRRYDVNLIVDNAETKGIPVNYIENPSHGNIIGEAGHDPLNLTPPHMRVNAGKLHKSNGGAVIIDEFVTIGRKEYLQDYLLTILQERKGRIGGGHGLIGGGTSGNIETQPVDADCIVMACANENIMAMLENNPQLNRRFSHKVIFLPHMENTHENRKGYAEFVAHEINKYNADPRHLEKLPHFSPEGVAALVEIGCRAAQSHVHGRDHLTNVLASMTQVVHRAALNAIDDRQNTTGLVGRRHVYEGERDYRRMGEQIREQALRDIQQGLRILQVTGRRVGVANGLGVLKDKFGLIAFGAPMRVQATASPGRTGIRDLDHLSGLEDESAVKRYYTIEALLKHRYTARLLEHAAIDVSHPQVYQKTGGDSDSIPFVQAIRSALSGYDIDQSKFFTGSLSQDGKHIEVQPVGGVPYKAEGALAGCILKGGLTGEQGVVIPHQNIMDLILNDEAAQAVDAGMFHILPVSRIEELDELTFGRTTQEVDKAVTETLESWAELYRKDQERG
jgi:lon-related putative ATP-dependent protease